MKVVPLSPAIGAEIEGVDLSRDLSDETVARIRAVWLDHLLVFFRDQKLNPGRLLAFARRFGELSLYPFVQGMDDYPEIVEVSKKENEKINFGGVWHSDTTYLEKPPMGTMLYAVEVPPHGGDTLFANMYLAWESMSGGMQRLLEGLTAINSAGKPDAAVTRVDRARERPTAGSEAISSALHPVARTHPETGRKALYVSRAHTTSIEGFTVAESDAILAHIYAAQTRAVFTCRLQWSAGTLAFWDNRAAQHNATNDYHGYRCVMHRVTLAGDRPA